MTILTFLTILTISADFGRFDDFDDLTFDEKIPGFFFNFAGFEDFDVTGARIWASFKSLPFFVVYVIFISNFRQRFIYTYFCRLLGYRGAENL